MFITGIVLIFSILLLQVESRTQFKSIIAFGDSYTDNGSLEEFYNGEIKRIDVSSLHTTTSKTFEKSSDGPLWVEYLAQLMGQVDLYDFARSGSTANNELIFRGTQDMNTQVATYLNSEVSSTTAKNETTIYFMWTGVNDVTDLFAGYPENTSKRQQILKGVVDTIKSDMESLYKAGAKYIMFLGLVPLETLPMYHDDPEEKKTELVSLVKEYNTMLIQMIESQHNDVHFFDTNAAFRTFFTPQEIQQNSLEHCQSRDNCDNYIWYDKLHPSSKTHSRIAQAVYNELETLAW